MTSREWPLGPTIAEPRPWLTTLLARTLRGASRTLARWARAVRRDTSRGAALAPVLEFYAEAGAPEGALYVDGRLVGHLPGVTRL